MAITDFDFKSPGVQIREEDLSTSPVTIDQPGIIIIGTAPAGPAMQPVVVRNKETLESVFGVPQNANSANNSDDVYRYGNSQNPTYGLYAAKAWLSSGESPVTFVRLIGNDNPSPGGSYTNAGWNLGGAALSATVASNKTAYGIFVMPSASATTNATGSLAAVIYTNGAGVTLSGTIAGTSDVTSSACTLIKSDGNSTKYVVDIWSSDTVSESFAVDLSVADTGDSIRSVINSNPQKIQTVNYGSAQQKDYFVGESYEESVRRYVTAINGTDGYAFVAPLQLKSGGVSDNALNHQSPAVAPKTGWVISRDPNPTQNVSSFRADQQSKLFRIHSLHEGTWMHEYHINITDIVVGSTATKRSTFTIEVVRRTTVVERFSNLNLDRSSENYVTRRIGNSYLEWDEDELLFNDIGEFPNRSKYIRIEEDVNLSAGSISDPFKVPWGFFGPAKPKGFTHITGSSGGLHSFGQTDSAASAVTNIYVTAAGVTIPHNGADAANLLHHEITDLSASFVFPSLALTEENSRNGSNYKRSDKLGVRHCFSTDAQTGNGAVTNRPDYLDLVKYQVWGINADAGTNTEYSFVFSLDDVISDPTEPDTGNKARWYWESGSHAAGTAYTALSGSDKLTRRGPDEFSMPLFGGFDGVDITQVDPFSMVNVLSGQSEGSHYAFYSAKKAINIVSDEEQLPTTLISFPGLTNSDLLQDLKEVVEDRGDCMAVIDFNDQYKEPYENNGVYDNSGGTVADVIQTSSDFGDNMNSNRIAAYFPRVRMRDGSSLFTAPASVAAVGALAFNDANSPGPWFAPAGFNRGGLSVLGGPASGLSVIGTKVNLSKANKDELYEQHINPIARFPAVNEVVIFGQKTMSRGGNASTSALSRVNVRRLMIYLYHRIKNIADTTLFEQSVSTTFNNFTAQVQRVLDNVKSNFGITEYLVELEEDSAASQDKNLMYVKVYIKPARAIEFIAIDFVITKSDAEF